TFNADSLIVSAGAWSKKLLNQLGLELPLNPVRKTFAWFETNESLYNEKNFPAFTFETSDKQYYGFPSINGTGLKLGRHDRSEERRVGIECRTMRSRSQLEKE